MKIISKALVGAVAAGAMAVVPTAAASAQSRYYDRYDRDRGISVGDIIAGAVVIGGIAAVAGAIGRGNDYRYDDRYYRDGRYDYYNGNPRAAVEQCVNAANRDARSRGYRYAQVTQVRDVNDTNYGWKIKGNLVVDGSRGYYDRGYYDRGYNNRYGYNDRYGYRNQDAGSFTCWIDRGRVSRMDYSGIRGL
jgi:hypothetical protein